MKVSRSVLARPRSMIVCGFIGFFMLLFLVDSLRAYLYTYSAKAYIHSQNVQALHADIASFAELSANGRSNAVLCSFTMRDLVAPADSDVVNASSQTLHAPVETFDRIHDRAKNGPPSPAFFSLLRYLPHINTARSSSIRLKNARGAITNLTKQDSTTQYCSSLVDVLSKVYFINDLQSAQGVSALRVGQLENFQVNVDQAQQKLLALSPPQTLVSQHKALNEFFNDIRLDLREDDTQINDFSRLIQADYLNLQSILQDMQLATQDLQAIPDQLLIHSAELQKP